MDEDWGGLNTILLVTNECRMKVSTTDYGRRQDKVLLEIEKRNAKNQINSDPKQKQTGGFQGLK